MKFHTAVLHNTSFSWARVQHAFALFALALLVAARTVPAHAEEVL